MARLRALLALGALGLSSSLLLNGAAYRNRHATLPRCATARMSSAESTIEELIEAPELNRPSICSKKLDEIATASFFTTLDERIEAAEGSVEAADLEQIREVALTIVEAAAEKIAEVASAEAEASSAIASAKADSSRRSPPPPRKPTSNTAFFTGKPARADMAPARAAAPPLTRTADELERETRARNRHRLHTLLDAANVGVAALDEAVASMRGEFDGAFFSHMQWEVEQQVAAKNTKLLGILEAVVQRVCVEMETGAPEVQARSRPRGRVGRVTIGACSHRNRLAPAVAPSAPDPRLRRSC